MIRKFHCILATAALVSACADPVIPNMDASVDAGGPADAAPQDADRVDIGPEDADAAVSPTDAGVPDAAPDAGQVDAAPPDLGPAAWPIEVVSTNENGEVADAPPSFARISADGRYVFFRSSATNLVADPIGNSNQLFRKDLQTGAVDLVTRDNSQTPAGLGLVPRIVTVSRDGNRALFYGNASDYEGGSLAGTRPYLRDIAARTTVSRCVGPNGAGNRDCEQAILSEGGVQAAFVSAATNLIIGPFAGTQAYVIDNAGTLIRVSEQNGILADRGVTSVALSADGQTVAFNAAFDPSPAAPQIYVTDLQSMTQTLVSQNNGVPSDAATFDPVLSGDGRVLAFFSNASNLVAGATGGEAKIFITELSAGSLSLASVGPKGAPITLDRPQGMQLSSDGRYLVFAATPNDVGGSSQVTNIYRYDRMTNSSVRVSLSTEAELPLAPCGHPSISGDGRQIVFESPADLVPALPGERGRVFMVTLP